MFGLTWNIGYTQNIGNTRYFGLPDSQWFSKLNQVGYWKKYCVVAGYWVPVGPCWWQEEERIALKWITLGVWRTSWLFSQFVQSHFQGECCALPGGLAPFQHCLCCLWFSDYMIFWLTHFVSAITMRIPAMLTIWAVGPAKNVSLDLL